MILLIQRLLTVRIIRYGLVGGIGIPINLFALFVFKHLMSDPLYPLANACAFLTSNCINFILNQFFTYKEQVRHIHGWEWIRRYFRGQLTSLSATLIAYLVALLLVYLFHTNIYLANAIGIIVAFFYNFFISNRLVFRPTTTTAEPAQAEARAVRPEIEVTPGIETTPR